VFFYLRRKQASKHEPVTDTLLRHELHNSDVKPYLVEGTQIMELQHSERPVELAQPPVELDAGERRLVEDDSRA
jgi:hypothetical protein